MKAIGAAKLGSFFSDRPTPHTLLLKTRNHHFEGFK